MKRRPVHEIKWHIHFVNGFGSSVWVLADAATVTLPSLLYYVAGISVYVPWRTANFLCDAL